MNYIKGFDGLRGVSILLVLFTHLGLKSSFFPDNEFMQERAWLLFSGYTGVFIFFSLSGFLITTILLREKDRTGSINLKRFYIRRFLRLLPPLFIFYPIIAFLMAKGQIMTTSKGLLFSVFYLYNFVPNMFYTGELGHTWSLAVEEQFYLIWPLLVLFLVPRKLICTSTLIIGLCLLSFYVIPETYELLFNEEIYKYFKWDRWLIPAVGPIMVGSVFAVLNKYYLAKISFVQSPTGLMIAITCFLYPIYAPSFLLDIWGTVQSVGVTVFLLWILHNQSLLVVRILENKLLSFIGKISYGIYVYQGLFLRTGPSGNLDIQQFPINIVLTFVVAVVSYFTIERYAMKLKERFT
jgi:peptidoglycan/LPS O-acetylase OafA/YrhL